MYPAALPAPIQQWHFDRSSVEKHGETGKFRLFGDRVFEYLKDLFDIIINPRCMRSERDLVAVNHGNLSRCGRFRNQILDRPDQGSHRRYDHFTLRIV